MGLVGVVLLAQFLPRLMGDDLAAGTTPEEEAEAGDSSHSPELRRVFEVTPSGLDAARKSRRVLERLSRGIEGALG